MTHTPLTTQQLDDIDARRQAATPGPWGVYESGPSIDIAADLHDTGCGYRARRAICRLDDEPLDNDPTHREWTAEEDWAQVQADAAFIAHAREDVDVLLADNQHLRQQLALALRHAYRVTEIRADVVLRIHGYHATLQAAFAYCETEERKRPLPDRVRFELVPAPGGDQWLIHEHHVTDDPWPEVSDFLIRRVDVLPANEPERTAGPGRERRTLTEPVAEPEPTPLRWGLDDVMYGDDDTTIVMLTGPAGAPYWLELDPERTTALRDALAGPDTGDTADDDPEFVGTRPCGHDDYHGPHEWHGSPGTWCPGISFADDEPAARPVAAADTPTT